MSLFKGAGVALITPFNEDNSVNYEMLRTLVKRQIDGGTDAIIVCGTTGEPATMTEEEKLSVIKYAHGEEAGAYSLSHCRLTKPGSPPRLPRHFRNMP